MIDFILKYWLHGIAFIGGIFVKYLFELYCSKIAKIPYEINKSFLGASGQDAYFGKVQVLYNDYPVTNLYLCTINLVNSTNKDFKDLKITVWSEIDSVILVANAQKLGTVNVLKLTDEHLKQILNKNNDNAGWVWSRRVYDIPVLNRDDRLTFSCLVTNPQGKEPHIYLDCEHQGVKLNANFAKPNYFLGERSDLSTLWGWIICILLLIAVLKFISSPAWVGVIAFLLGTLCMLPGIFVLKIHKLVKKLFR